MKSTLSFRLCTALLIACGIGQARPGSAALLNISDTPMFLGLKVEPNIVLSIDDSGSMDWEVLTRDASNDGRFTGTQPDGTSPSGTGSVRHRDNNDDGRADCTFSSGTFYGYSYIVDFLENTFRTSNFCNVGDEEEWRMRNSDFNALYFNPNRTYRPWAGFDKNGNLYTDMPVTAAKANPYNPSSPTIDLTRHKAIPDSAGARTTADRNRDGVADGFRYYTWTDTNGNGLFDNGEETVHYVRNESAAVQQNFANWFSYHRSREFIAKAAYSQIIADAINSRMGLVTLHNNRNGINSAVTSVNTPVRSMNVDPATGNKRKLLDALFSIDSEQGTPLRPTLKNIGQYLECNSSRTLFTTDCPALSATEGGSCQQNFVVFMTDGFDNGGSPSVGNTDIDGTGPFDGGAYADNVSNTLADVAMYYYERDLQPSLANKVPTTPGVDEAKHQHMVTYTISFGLNGLLSGDPPNRTSPFSWPDPNASDAAKIDDLRHAAFNGRGKFLNARNSEELAAALKDAVGSITERNSSAASVALNSGAYSTNTRIFQARFNSGDWSGQLWAYPIQPDGSIGDLAWDAGIVLDGQNYDTGRTILTYKPSTHKGIPFRWANLDTAQQTVLHTNNVGTNDGQGSARLNYLRGSRADEDKGNKYRKRIHVLGDLINSDPYFSGAPPFPANYGDGYDAFRAQYANRTPMVLIGGNDGFLHAFDGNTGQELLAYLPNAIFSQMNKLTFTTYAHRYYVDGSPTVGDVQLTSSGSQQWRTIVVGGLRAGGQGFYALDITDPSQLKETNASNIVLWEFTDADDADLGLTYSQVSLVRMSNGRWAAVVGNGYNNSQADGRPSTTGRAMLFILFLDGGLDGVWTPGVDYIKIDTGVGDTGTPNGLSSPTPIDVDQDYKADYIVAGDLRGNLWTFDVTDTNPANWKVAFKNSSTGKPVPFFSARDANGVAQPITERPEVWRHPSGRDGFMVFFGTGKYLEPSDDNPVGATPQTVYGLWDERTGLTATPPNSSQGPITGRSQLLPQTMVQTTAANGTAVRVTSNTKIDWGTQRGWYLDLPTQGEKQVSDPVLREGRLIFTTLIPDPDVCSFGGTSWLMEINVENGGRVDKPPFDLNDDQKFDKADMVPDPSGARDAAGNPILVNVGGVQSPLGILPTPTILAASQTTDFKYSSSSGGDIFFTRESTGNRGRLGWQQLL